MTKEKLIQLTQELYRLTLLFPKKEPLRYKMREIADDILVDSSFIFQDSNKYKNQATAENLYRLLEVLDSFFEVAKNQNWVSPGNILNLQQEYSKLKEEFKKIPEIPEIKIKAPIYAAPKVISLAEPVGEKGLTREKRQERILEILKEKGRIQVWEIKKIFLKISKRTLRRDFESLLKQGAIERFGERNNTFYQLKAQNLVNV